MYQMKILYSKLHNLGTKSIVPLSKCSLIVYFRNVKLQMVSKQMRTIRSVDIR